MGFTIAYTAVVWTAGDIITEAKMDNMVANDQAYDAHAAQGLELDEMSAPSTPATGKVRIYAKTDGKLYIKDDAGTETDLAQSGGGGGIITTSQYAPQGFLINGLIVPSVASNDLTVAIKGMDGNDPSVSNPVYCRIGDTVRTLTSALSKTLADGTNWFNAGSSELAAKEIDYFVYLGYNATDGITLGFARVPFGTRYDSFSTTTTNDNYCAISTITNAAAGDYYQLIGRFAATLSAGAGYTWTVPTFTALNLVQRPIYETRWLTWLPTYSSNGSMTYTSVTGTTIYKLSGDVCHFIILVAGTTAGSTTTGIGVTLPITSFALDQPGASSYYDAGGGAGFFTINTPWNIVYMYKQAEATWGIGSNRQIKGNNLYRIK